MKPEWMDAIKAPNPETLVDRLNGIYPSALGPYKASPLEKEAAGEILRLRALLDGITVVQVEDGDVVAVTLTSEDGQIQKVIWEK